jgi:YHS domain-containing protein
MKRLFNIGFAAALVLMAGCATATHDDPAGSYPMAACRVCEYNNDLACVCVKVKDSTPMAIYAGTTNYFCSEDCRAAFLKRPEKYLQRGKGK